MLKNCFSFDFGTYWHAVSSLLDIRRSIMSDQEEPTYDEWGYHSSSTVLVDFLLPTGIYIPLNVERNWTIEKIKKVLCDIPHRLYFIYVFYS